MTQICIHQAADTIWGNCIEVIASGGERILLDAGRPLDAPDSVQTQIPISLKTDTPICGIFLSHAHTDHPAYWKVFHPIGPSIAAKRQRTYCVFPQQLAENSSFKRAHTGRITLLFPSAHLQSSHTGLLQITRSNCP